MRLEPVWVEVILGGVGPAAMHGDLGDVGLRAAITGATTKASLGPLTVEVEGAFDGDGWRLTWSITNASGHPEAVRSVRLGCAVVDREGDLRFWRHGYQSWSPSSVSRYGVDLDPSLSAHSPRLLRAMYHADEDLAEAGELRSELVCVLADARGPVTVVGFLGASRHDGTLRLGPSSEVDRPTAPLRPAPADRPATLVADAFLGGAVLAPGEDRDLHTVVASVGDDPHALLVAWARSMGAASGARNTRPFQVGWSTPHGSTGQVTEAGVLSSVATASADGWPFDLIRLEDGYQDTFGDWLRTNAGFPSSLDQLAGSIRAEGFDPGIWIAPFLIARSSDVARDHPHWIARWFNGNVPLVGMFEERWGGMVYVLDTSNPEVLAHLEQLGRDLVDAGFRHLKIDFGFAPSCGGRFHDPTLTPAQRVRAGYDAIRRGVGDAVTLVSSGAPLGPLVGVVDANQTGPNVRDRWEHDPVAIPTYEPYAAAKPAIAHAVAGVVQRAFQHRALWSNDPHCFGVGSGSPLLSAQAALTWGEVVARSGSSAIGVGDLAAAGADGRKRFEELVAMGRDVDAEAAAGRPASSPSLLDLDGPARLASSAGELVIDLASGVSEVVRATSG